MVSALFFGPVNDFGNGTDFILQHQKVAGGKVTQHAFGIFCLNLPICSAVNDDGILAVPVHLDHRMTRRFAFDDADVRRIHTCVFKQAINASPSQPTFPA